MNILMMTNTYLPHVGGVANSVSAFTAELKKRNHNVVVVAPEYKNEQPDHDVIRIPAIQNFNGSDFSVILPIPTFLEAHLEGFRPDIVHSHHPFLIGSTAFRVATKYNVPLVYTQHTMLEQYTHYVPMGLERLKQFVVSLSTGYANMSDQVLAPSQSTAKILKDRQVKVPIEVIPTGVDIEKFANGDPAAFRKLHNIPNDAFIVGHVGRLAPEKNLLFLVKSVACFLQDTPQAHFIIIGYGSLEKKLQHFFENQLSPRVHFIGKLQGSQLIDAYHAMDVFAFSSKSETQGMVLAEAMAAATPVVALDASGVREVLRDNKNGFLLHQENEIDFALALKKFYILPPQIKDQFKALAIETARDFSISNSISKLLRVYEKLKLENRQNFKDESAWQKSIDQIKTEWTIFSNLTNAVSDAFKKDDTKLCLNE